MNFQFERLEIPEIILIKPKVRGDSRGFFMETYKFSEFREFGIDEKFNQDNYSKSSKGVLRGLHYQLNPYSQGKLVRCTNGSITDVAVDIRKNSPTYGKHIKIEINEENNYILWVPEGFAHGFLTKSNNTQVHYKATNEYNQEYDRGIAWDDPFLNIDWGIKNPSISEKDKNNNLLRNAENNFIYK